MFATLSVVLPIFGLILTGYLCRKYGVLDCAATTQLNRFVVYLALPALLLDVTANATWQQLYQPGFIAAFGLGCGLIFALTVALRLRAARTLADATIDGLAAAYANTGYVGFPLCLLAFGRDGTAPVAIASIITIGILFGTAIVLVEVGQHSDGHKGRMTLKVARSLAGNPLLIAPALGIAFAASGLHMPTSGEAFLKLLSAAASPCALVGLGLFIAETRTAPRSDGAAPALLTFGKLVLQPALTWFLAFRIFALPAAPAGAAVLLAALPTGTGPFMLAELYRREAIITSRTILLSTIGSLLTLSLVLYLAAHNSLG
jgi:predicted permease